MRISDWSSDVCSSDLTLPAYAADSDAASLYVRYAARDVVYLLGSADNNPEDHDLDKPCGAEAQGATRLSRGLGYLRYERPLAGRGRSAERRVGTEGVRTCRSRWSPDN